MFYFLEFRASCQNDVALVAVGGLTISNVSITMVNIQLSRLGFAGLNPTYEMGRTPQTLRVPEKNRFCR